MEYTENKKSSGVAKAGLSLGIVGTALGGLAFLNNGGLGGALGGLGNGRVAVAAAEVEQSIIAAQGAEIAELKSMRYTDMIGLDLYKNIQATHDHDMSKLAEIQTSTLIGLGQISTQVALNKQAQELNREFDIAARDYQFRILDDKLNCCYDKTNMQIEFNRQFNALADASIISYVNSNFLPGTLKLPATSVYTASTTTTS